jgi:ABC-type transport system substrate-binding protein
MICNDKVEALWKRYEASTSPAERQQLSQAIQRYTVEEYLAVPLYINPFVHAVGPKVAGNIKSYYATPQAPYPYPWENWQVKTE